MSWSVVGMVVVLAIVGMSVVMLLTAVVVAVRTPSPKAVVLPAPVPPPPGRLHTMHPAVAVVHAWTARPEQTTEQRELVAAVWPDLAASLDRWAERERARALAGTPRPQGDCLSGRHVWGLEVAGIRACKACGETVTR